MNKENILESEYSGKTVLITGHTGFKGSWLTAWLIKLGANVVGISLDPPTHPSHYLSANMESLIDDHRIDIRDNQILTEAIINAQPDFVFHLAAQAIVKKSYENPLETWQTNVIGTFNVMDALKNIKKKCIAVMITSDKCYENVEWVWGYRETDALGGPDPYSASKGAAELVIRSQIKSFFNENNPYVKIAVARAGNVIGGGDWALDRIVPDCVKSWARNDNAFLRNPLSTRPWQHVLEPLSGYLMLAYELKKDAKLHGEVFNFGPRSIENHNVEDLVREMSRHWKRVSWLEESKNSNAPHEASLLKLNCDKALFYLNWYSAMNFSETVKMTAQWYKNYYEGNCNILNYTNRQISEYTEIAHEKKITWAL